MIELFGARSREHPQNLSEDVPDRQTDRQIDRQTDRSSGALIYVQLYINYISTTDINCLSADPASVYQLECPPHMCA
jgi:hypothetical protein